ncbi:hypothetical protein [Phyllobacterium phragmitis]|uniref:hypothetical protein n=1 Tax=Phyllobacterium phragmitis TaxID=2670329 RepID=UPI0038B3FBD3
MNMKLAIISAIISAIAAPAMADNTITVNLKNSTGGTLTLRQQTCRPDGTCTLPVTIPAGATGKLQSNTQPDTFIRSFIARYGYSDGTKLKSCQVSVSAYGPSSSWTGPGCEPNTFRHTFIKTDGTGSSPTCTTTAVATPDYERCIFSIDVTISN